MARIARTLIAATVVAVLLAPAPTANAQQSPSVWHAPVVIDGKAFPVLLPADGRWLNWRDTYGAPRMRFVNGTWVQTGVHQGIDIFAEKGSPIVSITSGTVENAGWTFYSGWRVGVRGDDGRYYFYAHMTLPFGPGIVRGARVRAGQVLGRLGNSGYGEEGTDDEFPPHLHFGLQSSRWENPQSMLESLYRASVESIDLRRQELRQLDLKLRALQARSLSPGSPETGAVKSRLRHLTLERERLWSSMIHRD